MSERTLTPGLITEAAADIRDHGYAILQTRTERVPFHYRSPKCTEPDGCHRSATLITLALAEITTEGPDDTGFNFARDDAGEIFRIATCDEHRAEASHDLYHGLTGRTRPDGIRAFDVPGQHLNWQ
ncbi:hypothetical protein [Streptomyces sp. NPDC058108]|uniref:hypothetical protein n=1 Tax=Streptomyces sp. NPDC058108 TaxID=3346344 RepID=UPI0036E57F73